MVRPTARPTAVAADASLEEGGEGFDRLLALRAFALRDDRSFRTVERGAVAAARVVAAFLATPRVVFFVPEGALRFAFARPRAMHSLRALLEQEVCQIIWGVP
jgi:hypothetical protein